MGSFWKKHRPNFLSREGGIPPGFHILYKTVTHQWPHFSEGQLTQPIPEITGQRCPLTLTAIL